MLAIEKFIAPHSIKIHTELREEKKNKHFYPLEIKFLKIIKNP